MSSFYVLNSPYSLRLQDQQAFLFKDHHALFPVEFVPKPKFYDLVTRKGVPYSKIALLHGKDCLATSVFQKCSFWNSQQRCRFCGIELSLADGNTIEVKSPSELAELALKSKELDLVRHVVLTTGTQRPPGKEIFHLAKCTKAIKNKTKLPVHVQCMPPSDMDGFKILKDSGVDTIGIHIECFDKQILSHIAPVKASIGLERYKRAWKDAVDIFGANQVSSFIIVGLGERIDSVIWGSEYLSDLGVFPFVVPLRPIPGSLMENALPPDPEVMKYVYNTVAENLKTKGLSSSQSKAGCVLCGACSAISRFEQTSDRFVCYPAITESELSEALKIRRQTFVKEQKMFLHSDEDDNDSKSVHLLAKMGDKIVGTVRVFPTHNNGTWIGGRLSVKKSFRTSGVGKLLVQEAVRYVKRYGCCRFVAYIQKNNVSFFSHLGWKPVGSLEQYCGKPHQLMEVDLD